MFIQRFLPKDGFSQKHHALLPGNKLIFNSLKLSKIIETRSADRHFKTQSLLSVQNLIKNKPVFG